MRTERKIKEPVVAVAGGEGLEGDHLQAALDMLPVNRMIGEGDVVVITPNWVKSEPPEMATTVGPGTLKRLIQYVRGFNPGRIVIAAGSGGDPTPKVMQDNGYDKVVADEGVEFIDLNYGPYIEITLNNERPSKTKINKLLDEMTVLISFTQLKAHAEATASMAIKNIALAWPPAEEHGFPKFNHGIHDDLHSFIFAMGQKIPIDLSIVSADKAMVGTGPSGGKPVPAGLILVGTDPVSVDTVGARLLGFYPQAVHYLYRLMKAGVGEADLQKVQMLGMPLEQAEETFSLAAYQYRVVMDEGGINPIDHMQ